MMRGDGEGIMFIIRMIIIMIMVMIIIHLTADHPATTAPSA
jgi:hypothetical protein